LLEKARKGWKVPVLDVASGTGVNDSEIDALTTAAAIKSSIAAKSSTRSGIRPGAVSTRNTAASLFIAERGQVVLTVGWRVGTKSILSVAGRAVALDEGKKRGGSKVGRQRTNGEDFSEQISKKKFRFAGR